MHREEEVKRVIELISLWITKIKGNNHLDFYDINRVAEDLARQLLNEIYDLKLRNLNEEKRNHPGVDLGDDKNKIAYQITSQSRPRKIQESLESFAREDKKKYFNGIRFLLLNERKPKLTGTKWQEIDPDFNPREHIVTYLDLVKKIKELYVPDRARFNRIRAILEEEVAMKGLKDGKEEVKQKQIKILSIIASPEDMEGIYYEKEQDLMLDAFKSVDREEVYLDMPDPVKSTLTEIQEHLQDGKHDILHIAAHGGINKKGEGILCLENHQGNLQEVKGDELVKVLVPPHRE
jgi:hypothetical protein